MTRSASLRALLLGLVLALVPATSGCRKCPKCVQTIPPDPCPVCPACPESPACPACPACPDVPPSTAPASATMVPWQPTLLWQCGNTLNITPVGLPSGTKLEVKASSSSVLPSQSDLTKFTIVPTGKTAVVSADALVDGVSMKLATRKYAVIKPPMPRFQLIVNGKEYNGAVPISKKSNVTVRVVPDHDFRARLPKDARYMVDKVELLAQRSLGAPTKVGSFSGSGKDATKGIPVPLGNKLKQDTPGTKIYFKIGKVFRVNFQNKKIEEKFSDRELYVGAVIK